MQHRIRATTLTNAGRVRERNEDSAYAMVAPSGESALLIVADGMGGYRAGDRASQIAVQTIRTALEPLFGPSTAQPTIKLPPKTTDASGDRTTIELPETATSSHYSAFITGAVREANQAIISYGHQHREARGMGSTVTLATIVRNVAYFANVGDSRSYLFRQGTLRAITRDHSLVARLVESGEIEPDDIYVHPKRNLIYRSLGAETFDEPIEVDLFQEDLQSGDMILLCSDGLWEKIRSPEIVAILGQQTDLDIISQQLIDLANQNGGEDNITIVLACYEQLPDEVPETLPRPEESQ